MAQKKILYTILFVFLVAFQTASSQVKPSINVGTGFVLYGNTVGVGGDSEITIPVNKYVSCGLNLGYLMASDKKMIIIQTNAYNHNSLYYGDLNLYFNPFTFKNIQFFILGGGGIRHHISTQVLVNSNSELNPSNVFATGVGFKIGSGINYSFKNNYFLGFKYMHDFYKDGFDFFGVNFGLKL